MAPKHKSVSQLSTDRQRLVSKTVSDTLEQYCPSLREAHLLLNKAFSRCQSVLPGLSGISGACSQLVSSLGDLRASVAEGLETTASHPHVKNATRKLALWPGAKIVQRKVCVRNFVPRKKNTARVSKRNRRRKHFLTHARIT